MAGHKRPNIDVELRHLRYFVMTAEEMNFGRAAERLGIAQPGLSQQIKALETIVGTPLFDRTRRSVQLTLAGELLVVEARKTIAQSEMALLAARQAGRGEVGRIAIGYVGSAAYTGMLTKILNRYRDAYPNVKLEISEMEMMQQLAQINEGKLDIGFIRPPINLPVGVACVQVLRERLLYAITCPDSLNALEAYAQRPCSVQLTGIFVSDSSFRSIEVFRTRFCLAPISCSPAMRNTRASDLFDT